VPDNAVYPAGDRDRGRLRVLLSAYACQPERGSEPGIGWNWVRHIAGSHDIWVITRRGNRTAIEAELLRNPLPGVKIFYFDLPKWARFWKKGNRGIHAYYYLWQIGAYRLMAKLQRDVNFHVVHHVTFGTCWFPSFLSSLGVPFVWGTVGGAESCPKSFWNSFGLRGRLHEWARRIGQLRGYFDPCVRYTARRAAMALATTDETAAQLRAMGCRSVAVLPHAALSLLEIDELGKMPQRNAETFRVYSVGRMLHWKGFHLGIDAFAAFRQSFQNSEYWIFGAGPERKNLERRVSELSLESSVRFFGEIPRRELLVRISECDVMLHTTLHDSGGWASVEAMASGRPVICFDLGGPALQVDNTVGRKVLAIDPIQACRDASESLLSMAANPSLRLQLGEAARRRVRTEFNWEVKAAQINQIYRSLAAQQDAATRTPTQAPVVSISQGIEGQSREVIS
jgi:glycosyltransferase involved in cell wall biosynthesis